MKKNKKLVALICTVLLLVGAAGATLAWLTDQSGPITNTFTASDINIILEENASDFKMIPGSDITKDPKVTVEQGSEACYLFVEVTKSENYDEYLADYEMAEGWTLLEGNDGYAVYWRAVPATTDAAATFDVLKGDKVTVLASVTKAQMDAIDGVVELPEGASKIEVDEAQKAELELRPTLTFKAYAVQQANLADAAAAWAAR